MKKKEISLFSVGIFFLTVPKNFVGGSIQYFRKIQARKNSMHRKGLSIFSVETFFSHSAENFCGWKYSMFQKNSGMEKFLCRRRTHHYFLLELFYITVPKNFVRGIIQCFRNIRACEKFM